MTKEAETLERAELRRTIEQWFQMYVGTNPEIPRAMRRIWGLETAGYDFQAAIWPVFDGLRMVTDLFGDLPRISENSSAQARAELHAASRDVLGEKMFEEFRVIIGYFKIQLDGYVQSENVKRRVERTFAMILRMIQIEQAAKAPT